MENTPDIKLKDVIEKIIDVQDFINKTLEYSKCSKEQIERFDFCLNATIKYEIPNRIKDTISSGSILDEGLTILKKTYSEFLKLELSNRLTDSLIYGYNLKVDLSLDDRFYYSSLQEVQDNDRVYYMHSQNNKIDFLNDMFLILFVREIKKAIDKIEPKNIDEMQQQTSSPLLKWNAPTNSLFTLFYDLLSNNIIKWNGKNNEGAKAEIARMLSNYFVDKDNKQLSIETIKQTLKPDTPKAKKRIDIKPLILPSTKIMKKT